MNQEGPQWTLPDLMLRHRIIRGQPGQRKKRICKSKNAVGGLKDAMDELVDVMEYVQAGNGMPDVNGILQKILDEQAENSDANVK
jgi:hypothetical protein